MTIAELAMHLQRSGEIDVIGRVMVIKDVDCCHELLRDEVMKII